MLAGSQAQGFPERRPFPGKAQVELRPESCLPRSPGAPTIHLAEQNVTRMLITPRAGVALPCHGQSPDRCSGRGGHCRAPPPPGMRQLALGGGEASCSFVLRCCSLSQLEAAGWARPRAGAVLEGGGSAAASPPLPEHPNACRQQRPRLPHRLCCLEAKRRAPAPHRGNSATCCPGRAPRHGRSFFQTHCSAVISKQLSALGVCAPQ